MIRHLKLCDFKVMPWANGRGQTVEMWREERDGALLWRLSRAVVAEDGAFSLFPGFDRNLTVIDGPGFDLVGVDRVTARYLQPVTFAGDVAIKAERVSAPSEDFNVMVRRGAVQADVRVLAAGRVTGAVFALEPVRVGDIRMAQYELVLCDEAVAFVGLAVVVRWQMC